MRVELDEELLDGKHDPLLVLGLLAMGLSGRHRVLCSREALGSWLKSYPTGLREEVEVALELSEEAEALGPDLETVRVGAEGGVFIGPSPMLTPREATEVLGRPLQVVVENGDNDKTFLYAFADAATRRTLEEAEDKGWIEFWNGGGIHGCLGRARQLAKPNAATIRTLIYTDSDAKKPGARSEKAEQVASALLEAEEAHEQESGRFGQFLSRRAAENYLPGATFAAWWRGERSFDVKEAEAVIQEERVSEVERLERQDPVRVYICARVFGGVNATTRAHYDMDWGHKTGKGTVRTDKELWEALSAWERAALRHGLLKTNIRMFYAQARELDDPSGEIPAILDRIRRSL